ncbi:hypothetical protein AKJ09_10332 [Labilithrix luteola]|uniref:Uncharacterized protein n=1 Tax=Labilithrix luteola TaxID=1391654 RepID=A0A0K1QD44_9BACT|nr:hypothetical protein AKJ09_10332 [Labilithrix luteola]
MTRFGRPASLTARARSSHGLFARRKTRQRLPEGDARPGCKAKFTAHSDEE